MNNMKLKTAMAALVLSLGALTAPAYAECDLCNLAKSGNLGAIQELWEMQNPDDPTAPIIDIDGADNRNRTAIFFAARKGHLDVVNFLIDQGADAAIASKVGRTPLMNAAEGGHNFILLAIHESAYHDTDADIDAVLTSKGENRGKTAWDLAVDNGHNGAGLLLINRNATPSFGVNTFAYAREVLNADLSHALMNERTVDTPFGGEDTVLLYAVKEGNSDLALALVADGAECDPNGDNGLNAQSVAHFQGYANLTEELIVACGETPDCPPNQEWNNSCVCVDGYVADDNGGCSLPDPEILRCAEELNGYWYQGRCITEEETSCSESDGTWDIAAEMCDCPDGTSLIGLHCLANCGVNKHRVPGNTACVCVDGFVRDDITGSCRPECTEGGHYVNEEFGCHQVESGEFWWRILLESGQALLNANGHPPEAYEEHYAPWEGLTRAFVESGGSFSALNWQSDMMYLVAIYAANFHPRVSDSHRAAMQEKFDLLAKNGIDPGAWEDSVINTAVGYRNQGVRFLQHLRQNYSHLDVNQRGYYGGTPLYAAVAHNKLAAVQILLEWGADCNIATDNGYTPWTRARDNGYTEISAYLTDNCPTPEVQAASASDCIPVQEATIGEDGSLVIKEAENCEDPDYVPDTAPLPEPELPSKLQEILDSLR